MSPTFNNFKLLEAYLLSQVQNAMDSTLAEGVKDLESKNVKEIVYGAYSPVTYDRDMDDGGLSDTENMYHEVKFDGNSISLTVDNKTMSNSDYNPHNKSQFEIAGLIEYGNDGGYGNYDYPFGNKDVNKYSYLRPRKFIERTYLQLENGRARELLIKGLRSKGMNAI